MHLTVSNCFTSFDILDAPGLRLEPLVTERHLETVENTMTAASKLVAFRDLNKALQANLTDWHDCDTPREEGLVMIGETEAGVAGKGLA